MAWNDPFRENNFIISLVDKNGNNLGSLDGFVCCSFDFGYETELRKIAQLTTKNDNYPTDRFPMINIQLVTTTGEVSNMGTYCIEKCVKEKALTTTQKSYDLNSICYKAKTSLKHYESAWTGIRTLWSCMMDSGVDDGIVHYGATDGVENWTHDFGADPYTLEAGKSHLSMVSDFCDLYNCRYTPIDYSILIEPYQNPEKKPIQFTFAEDNGTISSNIEVEEMRFETPNYGIDEFSNNDVKLIGHAQHADSTGISPSQREQFIAKKWTEDSINPVEQWVIDQKAAEHLNKTYHPKNHYKFSGIYVGLAEGDVCELIYDGLRRKCLVLNESVNEDFAMTTDYELREIND